MRRGASVSFLIILAAAPLTAQVPESMDADAVPNYRLIEPRLATSGQPTPEALGRLKEQGFKTVVNLRMEAEGAKDEEKAVSALGLRYVWVPISPATFSLKDVEAVAKVLGDPSAGPALVHCASGNRVGAVWTVLQVQKGKSLDEAEAEAAKIAIVSPAMKEAVRRVLGR